MSALDDIAWYNTLLQTGGKTCDRVVFDELIEADSEDGGAEMSERREFVKVERMEDKARYSVTVPIEVDPIHARMDELEQRISDVNDANLYSVSQLEERIDALEERVEHLEADMAIHHSIVMLQAGSIERMWRKLNHKGAE